MQIEPIHLPLPRGCMGIQPMKVTSPCAMGIDQRPGSWDVAIADVVRPKPDRPMVRLVFYGKVRNEEDAIWLAQQYPVRCGVGDSRPDAMIMSRMVEKLRKMRKDFWRVQYNPNNANAVEMMINDKERLLTVNRTMAMDELLYKAATDASLLIPQNFREICSGAFASEICVPTRVPVIERGEDTYSWTDGTDHTFHALTYMLVALKVGKLTMGNSTLITTIKGAVEGSIASNSDSADDEFVDPTDPAGMTIMDDGRVIWGDDVGF